MGAAQTRTVPRLVGMDISEAHKRLDRMERQEWWRWCAALGMMAALAIAVVALAASGIKDPAQTARIRVAALGIAILVLFYILFVIWKQRLVGRARRELASQVGVIAALETLNLVVGKTPQAQAERRNLARSNCDQRLCVTTDGGKTHFYGRVRDLCEHGMGAIVPGALNPGEEVKLEFPLNLGRQLKVDALVRHRSGFRYGFEFLGLNESDYSAIERFRAGDAEVISIAEAHDASARQPRQE